MNDQQDKYVTFTEGIKTWTINRSSIVGYSGTPLLVWTNLHLDSGATIGLNGVSPDQVRKVLDEFDRGDDERAG